ncbi:GntR family transcriptional regulator [Peribacillus simplex]|uniref:GntR family transcriptional regulator n=1 Tax=Peribacillus simplex NBRC 15720 = DSM 1321 TaxID=1349754 RepID=A0A223EP35_9BACI|nr:GntR family transcriptional regulator [Peribacillus simplex]ASS96998.1 GntR family transcriptional regulator [Peribacillus simplex NBRC 15720 = DSM 1321]MEC1398664.1 GntR family transcriptional regulator [Peribacillus simplex]
MSEKAKYIDVKNKLKAWIVEGKIKPGEKIHSENEMVKMFGFSRHTIRQAVGELVHEGWLYREQGSGTFCTNRAGQSTMRRPRKNIGVITTYISDYIFPSIIRGIESYLSSQGYSLIMASTDNDIEREKHCLLNMLDKDIDGLIVEPTKSSNYNPNINYYLNLEQNGIPYLMINQYYSELNPPHIIIDDELGGFLATDHLIEYGHEKIVGIFKSDDLQGVSRLKGFINAFRNSGLAFFSDMVITYTTENREQKILEELKSVLNSPNRPTGIVCYNDEIALKVLNVFRELQLSVPEDISIVGYDDSHLAEASEVKLTTITHPKMKLGIDSAKWIISKIEGKNSENLEHSTIYKPELIIRNSTKDMQKKKRGEIIE